MAKITNKYLKSVNQDIAEALAMFNNPEFVNKIEFFKHIEWQVRDTMLRGAGVKFGFKCTPKSRYYSTYDEVARSGINLNDVAEIILIK